MGKAASAVKSQAAMLKRAKAFVEKLKEEFKIEEVYVVGSRARGDYLEDSDIDLVIICDEMKGVRYIDRLNMMSKYLEPGVEFLVLTREEWEKSTSPYMLEMKKEARRLDDLLRDLSSQP
ncbi:nucleotidyltransferase domain-containing protein [Infirmifilum lucidum]|uniref:Nucleotidyltransferase domain-containing protein n=1 Tax=Infirmifilum lucidum TaxID=2776706 RepID=A0A7L9FHR0_9CREN|nr:nucleotidyltransferase domain-containing protein [Infirmifilum lucidum]QOJ79257.1 nucleotidyltransferase domain-containing protein [Infirmifilum lucidum]